MITILHLRLPCSGPKSWITRTRRDDTKSCGASVLCRATADSVMMLARPALQQVHRRVVAPRHAPTAARRVVLLFGVVLASLAACGLFAGRVASSTTSWVAVAGGRQRADASSGAARRQGRSAVRSSERRRRAHSRRAYRTDGAGDANSVTPEPQRLSKQHAADLAAAAASDDEADPACGFCAGAATGDRDAPVVVDFGTLPTRDIEALLLNRTVPVIIKGAPEVRAGRTAWLAAIHHATHLRQLGGAGSAADDSGSLSAAARLAAQASPDEEENAGRARAEAQGVGDNGWGHLAALSELFAACSQRQAELGFVPFSGFADASDVYETATYSSAPAASANVGGNRAPPRDDAPAHTGGDDGDGGAASGGRVLNVEPADATDVSDATMDGYTCAGAAAFIDDEGHANDSHRAGVSHTHRPRDTRSRTGTRNTQWNMMPYDDATDLSQRGCDTASSFATRDQFFRMANTMRVSPAAPSAAAGASHMNVTGELGPRCTASSGEPGWYASFTSNEEAVTAALQRVVLPSHLHELSFAPGRSAASADSKGQSWFFVGYVAPDAARPVCGTARHRDSTGSWASWHAQVSGRKGWKLEPPPECTRKCRPMSFIVEEGDLFVFSADTWFHSTWLPRQTYSRGQPSVGTGGESAGVLPPVLSVDYNVDVSLPKDSEAMTELVMSLPPKIQRDLYSGGAFMREYAMEVMQNRARSERFDGPLFEAGDFDFADFAQWAIEKYGDSDDYGDGDGGAPHMGSAAATDTEL